MRIRSTPNRVTLLIGLALLVTVAAAPAINAQLPASPGSQRQIERFSVTVSAIDVDAVPIEKFDPVYPSMARTAGITGTVTVRVQVAESGAVVESTAPSGHPLLRQACANAVRQWTFAPPMRDGKAVTARGTIEFTFAVEVEAAAVPDAVTLDGSDSADRENVEDGELSGDGEGVATEEDSGSTESAPERSPLAEAIDQARMNPTSPELQVALAKTYFTYGMGDEAIAAYRTALQLKPDFELAVLGLGETYQMLGRIDDEILTYQQALLVMPNSTAVLRILGGTLSERKRFADSIPIFERLASLIPDDAFVANSLGWSYFRIDQLERADREFRRATAINPAFGQALHNLGAVSNRRGRHDDAIEAYSRILVVDPRYVQLNRVHRELAAVYIAVRRYDDAIDLLETVISDTPDFVEAYCQLSEAYMFLERLEDARKILKRAFVVDPDSRCALSYWAALNTRLRKPAEAEVAARRLVELLPEDLFARASFVRFLVDHRRFDEAVTEAKSIVAKEPAQYRWHHMLAFVLNEAGRLPEAEVSYRSALALVPDSSEALNALGYFLANHDRKLDEAVQLLHRAVEIEPKNGSILDSLGWALVKVGKLDDAERYLDEAVMRRPESAEIQEHVGDLALTRGQIDKAKKHWQQALTITSATDEELARIRAKLAKIQNPER